MTPTDPAGLPRESNATATMRRRSRQIRSAAAPELPHVANVMVDVETLGKRPGCTVLSIGATRFDPLQPADQPPVHLQGDSHFYTVISNLDSSARGLAADPDTLRWWKKQAIWPQLSMETMTSDVTVPSAAKAFNRFLQNSHTGGGVRLWANSPSFDVSILRALHKLVDEPFPVHYRQEMCYRTIMELAHPHRDQRPERPASLAALQKHHALGDAAEQAHHLIAAAAQLDVVSARTARPSPSSRRLADGDAGRHLMIEVKSLGEERGSALLSIGAVVFDPTGRRRLGDDASDRFYAVVSSFDMGNHSLTTDPQTLQWWKAQPIWPSLAKEAARDGVPLVRALRQLGDFIERKAPAKVWANSPSFDIEMLRDVHAQVQVPFPFNYRQEMDYRTVMELVHPDRSARPSAHGDDGFLQHHALGDALGQARALTQTLAQLKLDLEAVAAPRQQDPPQPGQTGNEVSAPRRRKHLRLG